MAFGRLIRHSPLYLYMKLYSLSVLVTLFASRPISSRLDTQTLRQIQRVQQAAHEAYMRRRHAIEHGHALSGTATATKDMLHAIKEVAEDRVHFKNGQVAAKVVSNAKTSGDKIAYALKTLASDADITTPLKQAQNAGQRFVRVIRRWGRRFNDMSMVKQSIAKEQVDTARFPELTWQAQVRCSRRAHPLEAAFVKRRSHLIASNTALLRTLGVDDGDVHADDIPTIGVAGSGGGYRATFGFLASLKGLHQAGVYDGLFWLAGVSGSCWTLASLYTVAHRTNPDELLEHYKRIAAEGLHPMGRGALDVVARSPKGVYFLIGPLLSKLRSGHAGIGVMDMYATLTTSYQLLSRLPHARPRLSRSMFQFSKIWDRVGIHDGEAPMPIFAAVRRSLHDLPDGNDKFQWWEMNPLEIGSSDEAAWIPTWSYGRSFNSGVSLSRSPEMSLSMLLGQATSAPAGPLTGYITTLLSTLRQGTIMSWLLTKLNKFVQLKRWEKRWGNPIRGAHEPNPLYGFGERDGGSDGALWESKQHLKLMDAGVSNNLPSDIFTCSARQADIIIAFDQSSDVQSNAALQRLDEYAKRRKVILVAAPEMSSGSIEVQKDMHGATHDRFGKEYAQTFKGWLCEPRETGKAGLYADQNWKSDVQACRGDPDFHVIYCPLLPNARYASYDPVNSSFSTSYNLVWTPEEIDTLARTATANTIAYVLPILQRVYRECHRIKQRRRQQRRQTQASVHEDQSQ